MDPIEQVGNTTDTASENIVSSPPQSTPVLSDEHLNEPKVTLEPDMLMPGTVPNAETLSDDVINSMNNVEISRRYELTLRSTRGVPLQI